MSPAWKVASKHGSAKSSAPMRSTDATEASVPDVPGASARGEAHGTDRARTEILFAGDDTSAVDAFHARTKWESSLEKPLSTRIRAFLAEPLLREIVSRSRNVYHGVERIVLPETDLGTMSLQEALLSRRSMSSEAGSKGHAIGVADLSAILKHGYGVIGERRSNDGPVQRLRTSPSAGALYPLEIYSVVMGVEGLPAGVYHYDAVEHTLSCLRREDARVLMPGFEFQAGLNAQASAVLVVTAVLLRSMAKYLDRGYRFVMNEAGALTQNFHLAAVARGVPGCVWGGFCDQDVAAYVGADGTREIVVLGFILGKRMPGESSVA